MAKVQGKKSAAGKKAATKPAARAKSAKPAPKAAKPATPKRPAKPVKAAVKAAAKPKAPVAKKKAAPPKPKVTAKGAAPAKATKPTKPAPKAVAAPAPKPSKGKAAVKTVAKVAAGVAAVAAVATVARVASPAASEPEKKRRRSRPKLSSSGPATAAWFSQGENKPRPSSFIPAPPRAEAPSLVAAPPASSDRLVSREELTAFVVRTVPVRIDVEAMGGGRIVLHTFPDNVVLKTGEGVEWDFRYVAGADVLVEEMIVELDKPSPFTATTFRSKRPGINRPHRQLSGPVQKSAAGKEFRYTVRALNAFKTEMATARPSVSVAI